MAYTATMRTHKKRKPGFVYLATGPDGHKIGSTGKITPREYEHRTESEPSVRVVWSLFISTDALAVKLGLHQRFAANRVRGEWYNLDANDLAWITSIDAERAAEIAASWKPTRPKTGTTVKRPSPVPRPPRKSTQLIDISGQKFARWTALSYAGTHPTNRKIGSMWLCRCECGTESIISRAQLVHGKTMSCGCYRKQRSTTHGKTKTPEYNVWRLMRYRCHKPTQPGFKHYGGRGIVVCDRWRESFENFLADMGERPTSAHSLERKDNNGPYDPDNCVWATKKVQVRNRRCTIRVSYNGETKTLAEWAEQFGIKLHSLRNRIFVYRWPVERAFTEPCRGWSPGKKRQI